MRAVNLGTARIVIIVALVVAGAAVLANGFPESGGSVAGPSGAASPSGSASSPASSPTTQPSPTGPSPETTGVTFMALNGTTVTGAGAAAQQLLTKHGYTSVQDAADAPSQGVAKTTVYYRAGSDAGQNKANAAYVATTYFNGASVKKLDPSLESLVPPSATIVVVVGDDFAQTLVQ
jgi:LytR cell envelope-related transcriptional attenuator